MRRGKKTKAIHNTYAHGEELLAWPCSKSEQSIAIRLTEKDAPWMSGGAAYKLHS